MREGFDVKKKNETNEKRVFGNGTPNKNPGSACIRKGTCGKTHALCLMRSGLRFTGGCSHGCAPAPQCPCHIWRGRSTSCFPMRCGMSTFWNEQDSSQPKNAAASAFAFTDRKSVV